MAKDEWSSLTRLRYYFRMYDLACCLLVARFYLTSCMVRTFVFRKLNVATFRADRAGFPKGERQSAIGGLGVCLRENGAGYGGLYCIIALLLLFEEVEKKVESS